MDEFDELFSAPINGFKTAHDWYEYTSSKSEIKNITIPTLIIQSLDDPIVPPE